MASAAARAKSIALNVLTTPEKTRTNELGIQTKCRGEKLRGKNNDKRKNSFESKNTIGEFINKSISWYFEKTNSIGVSLTKQNKKYVTLGTTRLKGARSEF